MDIFPYMSTTLWRRRTSPQNSGANRRAGQSLSPQSPLLRPRFSTGFEGAGRGLDAAFELGREAPTVEPGGDRGQELDDDPAGSLDEAAPAPEQPGIKRHRHHRQLRIGIEHVGARQIGPAA